MTVNDRILGSSELTGSLCLRPTWFLSGNVLSPTKDAFRRWLPCNLVTSEERPEERTDLKEKNLREYARDNRGETVRDALIILRYHKTAGSLGGGWGPLGSFEEWDLMVRGAVWAATEWDCCKTRRVAADESPERSNAIALMEIWKKYQGEGGMTVSRAMTKYEKMENKEYVNRDIREVFSLFVRDEKKLTANAIGKRIHVIKNTVYNGERFTKWATHKKQIVWKVCPIGINPPGLLPDVEDEDA
jgi:hypothetical protein